MKEKFLKKGNVVLFLITVAVTLITALICSLCGAERITVVCLSPITGVLSMLVVGALFEIANLKAPMGPEPGVLGVAVGTILTMIIF